MALVEFGEWAPDQPSIASKQVQLALNVVPAVTGYLPFNSFLWTGAAALPSRCRGAVSIKDLTGVSRTYLGTDTALYEVTGPLLTEVGGPYHLGIDERWSFSVYKNKLIASTITDPVQAMTIGETFSPLFTSTRKPQARCTCVSYLDWLTMANILDDLYGVLPTRVWWCERANPVNADPNVNSRSGFRDLNREHGEIVSLYGREFTSVFQQRAIHRMTFEGGGGTFRFDQMETNVGPIGRNAIAHFGGMSFYLSEAGFFSFDGTHSTPIGHGKVDRYVLNLLSHDFVNWISTVIFPSHKLVMWAIPTLSSADLSLLVVYNWNAGRWSIIECSLETIFNAYSVSRGPDDVDVGDLAIDASPQADWLIDSVEFMGGVPSLSGISAGTRQLVASAGSPMLGRIVSNYLTLSNRAVTDRVIPLVDGLQSGTLYVNRVDRLGSTATQVGPFGLNMFGEFRPCTQGRYVSFDLRMPTFKQATGLDIEVKTVGQR